MRTFLVCSLAVALAGCGLMKANETSRMDATQIQQVTNYDLCNRYVNSRVADIERDRRGLGNCRSPDDAINRATYMQLVPVGAQLAVPQRPAVSTATCNSVGGTLFCTGVTQ
jgi:hypothetical protein